jgi:endonuclease-3
MNSEFCHAIFEKFQAHNPFPETELHHSSPFEVLISTILSAQATDKSVNKATAELFKVANTPESMLNLGEENLKKYIKSIGLFNSKARNIIKTCQVLVDKYSSKIPNDRESLESLYGVGRKTANIVLNTVFNEPTIAVDTHIFRLANRTGMATGKNVKEVEDKLLNCVPNAYKKYAHRWLVLHGRYICLARHPKCVECSIKMYCKYPDKI